MKGIINDIMKFTVKIYKGEKFYIARVPELGVTTQGKTKEEAKVNLREAIQVHLEAMAEYAIKHGKVIVQRGQLIPVKR
jgi:predicted RNase H-like HicB family nuclease